MRVAVDTNILLYAEGVNDPERQEQAEDLLEALPAGDVVVPAQVLGELYRALVAKARWSPTAAAAATRHWIEYFNVGVTGIDVLMSAFDITTAHQLHIFDAIVLACAAEERCRLLISEDMQDGFVHRGVTVVNPFAPRRHYLLEAALRPQA